MNPDSNNLNPQGNLQEKLAGLESEFNPNKGFGLMGMMEANEEKLRAEHASRTQEKVEVETKDSETPPDWLAPINTTLQQTRNEFQQGLGQVQNELMALKQSREPSHELPSDLPPEVAPFVSKFTDVERSIGNLALRQEFSRAKDALRDAKTRFKDFNYSDGELNSIWQSHVRNNPNTAANTDWDNYFRTQYETRRNPLLLNENESLKKEIDRLKSTRNSVSDLYAVPRSNRQSATVRNNDDSDFDEDLYQRAKSKVQRGKFLGFNRALLEEQRKMALSA